MRVEFTNGTLYNGQDLKGYLLDFSLADIGFVGVYPDVTSHSRKLLI